MLHELSARAMSIYSQLSDDISRRVFCLRLSHYLLGKCFLHSQYAEEFMLRHPEVSSKIRNIINSWFLEYVNVKEICIYGAGGDGQATYYLINCFLGKNNERQLFFCDSDEQKQGTKLGGVDILASSQLLNMPNSLIIISISSITARNDVISNLTDAGIDKKRICVSPYYQIWHELSSRFTKKQYFDNDVFPCNTEFGSKQIFVDAGCFDFMTSLDYAKFSAAQSLKIIAFEPNPTQYSICKHNAKSLSSNMCVGGGRGAVVLHYGLWSENAKLSFIENGSGSQVVASEITPNDSSQVVEVRALDSIVINEMHDENDTQLFIKMDIEGAELEALKGAQQVISLYKPRLAICIYHELEHFLTVPEYILSLRDDYKFYYRHHSMGRDESVLYAE